MKRTFGELRTLILRELSYGNRTINQLAIKTGINWRTVELHLDFLASQKYAAEIVSSNYVRIFGITPQGAEKLGKELIDEPRRIIDMPRRNVKVKIAVESDMQRVEIQ